VAIPGTPGVSWVDHLGGLIGGIAAGWIFRTRRSSQGRTRLPHDSSGGSPGATVAVPTSPDHPRADLYKELGDLGL
jgi:hypothetical protein